MNALIELLLKTLQGLIAKEVPTETVPTKKQVSKGKAVLVVGVASLIAGSVADFEGLRTNPYRDVVGVMTVCYGHTGDVENREYSQTECDFLLDKDIKKWANKVEQCQPNLPIKVKAAFTSAAFNLGSSVICNSGTATLLKQGKYQQACERLMLWNKATINGKKVVLRGLTRRRTAEMNLCLQGIE